LPFSFTRHATIRARQRGIGSDRLDAFLSLADTEAPVGSGCVALSISRRLKRDRDIRAAFGPMLDRIADLALVMAEDGSVVTVMHDHGHAAARRYRRAH
jgi:hypothetical protein